MAEHSASELRTPILIQTCVKDYDAEGYPTKSWEPVAGTRWCKWTSKVGSDDDSGDQLGALEEATVLIRFNPAVTASCRVLRLSSNDPFEIIGPVVDLDDRHAWMQFSVRRKVVGQ